MSLRKYHNKPVTVDGHRFASQAEARRYGELLLLQRAGQILDLKLQPRYKLEVNGVKIGTYVGDFSYAYSPSVISHPQHVRTVEDVKGVRTAVYRLKKKLMLALHGIEIAEIGA